MGYLKKIEFIWWGGVCLFMAMMLAVCVREGLKWLCSEVPPDCFLANGGDPRSSRISPKTTRRHKRNLNEKPDPWILAAGAGRGTPKKLFLKKI